MNEWPDDLKAKGLLDLPEPYSFHFTPTCTDTELLSYLSMPWLLLLPLPEYRLPSPSNQPARVSSVFKNHLQKASCNSLEKVCHFPLCYICTCAYSGSTQTILECDCVPC